MATPVQTCLGALPGAAEALYSGVEGELLIIFLFVFVLDRFGFEAPLPAHRFMKRLYRYFLLLTPDVLTFLGTAIACGYRLSTNTQTNC